jgi:hypothetical protein
MAEMGNRKLNPNLITPTTDVDLRPYQLNVRLTASLTVGIFCAPASVSNSPIMPAGFISHTDIIPSPLPV